MPRYRFKWTNLNPQLINELCAGEDLRGRTPTEALRNWYGARPTNEFVAESWSVLRDRWLAQDDEACTNLVEALRAQGLGDSTVDVTTAKGRINYLRSCRNTVNLRRTVLDAFIRLGEESAIAATDTSLSALAVSAPPTWAPFESGLVKTLEGLNDHEYLILSVRGTGVEREGRKRSAPHFVQFAWAPDGLRAEVVSNYYLIGRESLGPTAQLRLHELGWHEPTLRPEDEPQETGSPNYFRDWQAPVPFDVVASIASRTLQQVFDVPHPGFLEYAAFAEDGTSIPLPDLGLREEQPVPQPAPARAEPEPATTSVGDSVASVLHELLEEDPERDESGDYGFQWGSAVVFVRPVEDPAVVRVWSPVLDDVAESPAIIGYANELSRGYWMVKAAWTGSTLILALDLFGFALTAEQLALAIRIVGETADSLDDELRERFLPTRSPAPAPAPGSVTDSSGGYL